VDETNRFGEFVIWLNMALLLKGHPIVKTNQLREADQEIVRMVFGFSFTGNGKDGALPQEACQGLIDP
jgi:hypothetical protein